MLDTIRSSTILLSLVMFGMLITPSFAFGQTTNEIDISKGAGFSAYAKCVTAKNCFYPNPLSIATGSTVIWRNTDKVGHFVISGKPTDNNTGSIFDSHGVIRSGDTFQFTFVNAGTYDYHCSAHPWMIGQVIVGGVSNLNTNVTSDYNILHGGNQTVSIKNSSSTPPSSSLTAIPSTPEIPSKIPNWVKSIFRYYAQGNLSDDDLIKALQFLIKQGIIKVN